MNGCVYKFVVYFVFGKQIYKQFLNVSEVIVFVMQVFELCVIIECGFNVVIGFLIIIIDVLFLVLVMYIGFQFDLVMGFVGIGWYDDIDVEVFLLIIVINGVFGVMFCGD